MLSRRGFLCGAAGFGNQPDLRTSTSLVIAPVTVRDREGKFVRGLAATDFVLFDGGAKQQIKVEEETMPVALVVGLHATFDARKPLARMRKAISLFGPLVVGETGRAALVTIRDEASVAVPLTRDFGKIEDFVRNVVAEGSGCSFVDAVKLSAELLADIGPHHRKVVVIMAEDRDRTSKSDLRQLLLTLQKQNITVYSLTYSPGLMQLGREVSTGP